MKRYAALVVAALLALLGVLAFGSSAQAQPSAYPVPSLQLTLSAQVVVSGHTFVGSATANIKCDLLTETWNGQSASAVGSHVSHTFTTPTVTHTTVIPLKVVCRYTVVTGTSGQAVAATTKYLTRTANVKVIPVATGAGKILPNTGGPNVLWFIVGGGAVVLGGGAMLLGRRRNSDKVAH